MKKHISLLMILVLLATALVGCGAKYEDGTYSGEAEGFNDAVKVEVTVKDGKISNVEVTEHDESEGIADPALEQIPAAIVDKNSTDIDAIVGATYTSDAIKEAVNTALEDAK